MNTHHHPIRQCLLAAALIFSYQSVLAQYSWTNFVGTPGGSGTVDGNGNAARFDHPNAVAVDDSGNVYVADRHNYTIRKITSAGVVSTLAGSAGNEGSLDGPGGAARFADPNGIAVDVNGNIYVTDGYGYTVRKITSAGIVSTLAGSAYGRGSVDGTGSAALFDLPQGVAVDGNGNVYVADQNNSTIRKITSAGVVTTLAGRPGASGSTDGPSGVATFNYPNAVAVDGSGNVYVTDGYNHTLRKITSAGVVSTLAGSAGNAGSADGTGSAARFNFPGDFAAGVAVDGSGNIYVGDSNNGTIRKVTSAGVVTTLAGNATNYGNANGTGSVANFNMPTGVAVDASGNVYVADFENSLIRKVTNAGVVTTLAGWPGNYGSADGTGNAARFDFPVGPAVDGSGNIYVADYNNHTIRKITSAGVVTTLVGSVRTYGSADGIGSAARFSSPAGVAVDSSGNVYVADSQNHTIRKITSAGVVTTLAGSAGNFGFVDGTGSAARFHLPTAVAADTSGTVYVADGGGVRKITSAAVVTTMASSGFLNPSGIAVDGSGNVYVADASARRIRKITSGGVVTTLAGSGLYGSADGTGSAASFSSPAGMALDVSGNLYVADPGNQNIRKITSAGLVTTIGGTAGVASAADGIGTAALFSRPVGIAIGAAGILYVADGNNYRISKGAAGAQGPVIAVEQFAGPSLVSGGALNMFAIVGTPASLGITIKNNGTSPLTGLTITKDGTNAADFSITSNPTAPVGPGGSTTFTLQFSPSSTGTKTAAIHIASNDATTNPFNINLTGTIGSSVATTGTTFGKATWRRPNENAANPPVSLSSSATAVPWDAVRLTVGATGIYSLKVTGTSPSNWDTYLFVYSTSFNSAAPLSNVLIGNDDFPDVGTSGFSMNLQAGATYWVVTTGYNNADSGAYSLTITGPGVVTMPVTVQGWRQTFFGTSVNLGNAADSADPDSDGLKNLLEFAFGLNPTQNSAGQLPTGQTIGSNFVISFPQPENVTGITYGAEWSATLTGTWNPITDTGTPPQHTFSVPIGSNTNLFVRLKVTSP